MMVSKVETRQGDGGTDGQGDKGRGDRGTRGRMKKSGACPTTLMWTGGLLLDILSMVLHSVPEGLQQEAISGRCSESDQRLLYEQGFLDIERQGECGSRRGGLFLHSGKMSLKVFHEGSTV